MGEWRLEEIIYIGGRRFIDTDKKFYFISSEDFFMNDIAFEGDTIIFGASPFIFSRKSNKHKKINIANIENKISMLNYKKIIFLSSASVYGFTKSDTMFLEEDKLLGTSPYAKEKIKFESLITNHSLKINSKYIILRIAGLFQLNPHMCRMDNFLDKIFFNLRNDTKEALNLFHSGNQVRNFCSTLFLKTVLDKLMKHQNDSVQYNIANTTPMKIINLIQALNRYLENPLLIDLQDSEEVLIHNALNCTALFNKYPDLYNLQINEDKLAKMITGTT